jgi:hypothetical protein
MSEPFSFMAALKIAAAIAGTTASIAQVVGIAYTAGQVKGVVTDVKNLGTHVIDAPQTFYKEFITTLTGVTNSHVVTIVAKFLWQLRHVSIVTLAFFLLGKTSVGKSVAGLFTAMIDRLTQRVKNGEGLPSLLNKTKIQAQNLKNKVEEIKANTPAKSPGRLKLDQELAELKLLVQKLQVRPKTPSPVSPKTPSPVSPKTPSPVRPKTPSPNYIYVGGRKIPLRRKPMSPAKAKEGRLRKIVRRVLHGRTEEEKMMKLAKALRRSALAASARSRSASAARSRSASAARSKN